MRMNNKREEKRRDNGWGVEFCIRYLFEVGRYRKIGIIQKNKNLDSKIRFCENR